MKVFIIALALFFSQNMVFAKDKEKQALYTYAYSDKPINFNQRQYLRYIRPQLEAIIAGFYDIIKKSHSEQENILDFRKSFLSHTDKINQLYKRCFSVSFDCDKTDWSKLHHMNLKLNKLAHGFRVKSEKLNEQQEKFLDQLLTFQSKLRVEVSSHMKLFESQYISGKFSDKLLAHFTTLEKFTAANLDLLMTGTVDKVDYQLFYSLWKNFISPIETGLNKRTAVNVLKKELVKLNVQWNGFHFQVDRKHFNVDSDIKRVIKNIHRRWTNILKVIVG